jgi:hypothetical protein
VQEVLFSVAERNVRSRRAVEKLGAELAGAAGAPRWGQMHVIYRLTPQLWARGPRRGTGRTAPATLLLQAVDDPVDEVDNSLVYFIALKKAGVSRNHPAVIRAAVCVPGRTASRPRRIPKR